MKERSDRLSETSVLIVGGGLAGLCCARQLARQGMPCQVFEASESIGGRAQTDEVGGFLLDRGFQVLLTAYPEAERVLDFERLHLGRFEPGALVRYHGKFHRFADPWRRPRYALSTALSPVASLADKLRVARLRRRVSKATMQQLFELPETTTIESLRSSGFSKRIIECFFRPFLGGVFLDRELYTSSRMFDFVFRMFALGDAALPAQGMGAISRQIADLLPDDTVQTQKVVSKVERNGVQFEDGESMPARAVVVACDAPSAAKLLGEQIPTDGRSVCCLYFAAQRPPLKEPVLVLNGEGTGPINNLCVPSQVCDTYAPPNQALISATVIEPLAGDEQLLQSVKTQLREWFGADVDSWRHLRTYRIPFALPNQTPPALSPVAKKCHRNDGIFLCGDYLDTASIQGAMLSGRRAADEILAISKPE
jgi:phytoene dehydrogenase-like protein